MPVLREIGMKKITVKTTDGKIHFFKPKEKDEIAGMMVSGMYVIFDVMLIVEKGKEVFRWNPDKKGALDTKKSLARSERAMFAPANILEVDIEWDKIEMESLILVPADGKLN